MIREGVNGKKNVFFLPERKRFFLLTSSLTGARPTDLIDLQRGSNMWCKMGWTVDVDNYDEEEGGGGVDLEKRKVGMVDNF